MGSSRSSSPVKGPQFFKIIDSDIVHYQKLRIPKRFVREHEKNLSSPVFLEVPSGAKWKIELVKSGRDVWLQTGWKEFADYYSIGLWHFLMYEGGSRFQVIIFDTSASEIEYPIGTTTTYDVNDGEKLPEASGRPCKKAKLDGTTKTSIPISFMQEYLTKKLSNVDVTLQVSDGRGYLVNCAISAKNAKFSTGWKQFATDNNLAVGDFCVFELIDDIKKVLKVAIFRAEKDT
ncbi:LOW QUALITY PROTEIN: hypothetical protein RJ639_041336 [Escallonia herrerae]|uniref:TF-B3 domain-containing protein n=1 Tax=Escallonia herrerae TaxID=1293975 RepID=A0AA88WH28_9ASTE|nr:LOW QUALITY PROTEIN: hypothetical protein RJ639_041336 [Escallonia herrerae]